MKTAIAFLAVAVIVSLLLNFVALKKISEANQQIKKLRHDIATVVLLDVPVKNLGGFTNFEDFVSLALYKYGTNTVDPLAGDPRIDPETGLPKSVLHK